MGSLLLASQVHVPDLPLHAATVRPFVSVGVRGVATVDSSAQRLVQRARGSDLSELTYAAGRRCCRTAQLQDVSPVNVTSSPNFRSSDADKTDDSRRWLAKSLRQRLRKC